jgi:hypothetical protein
MGAQLWVYEAAWHEDPSVALNALQARVLADNYHLAALLPQELLWARQALAAEKEEGDAHGLVDHYEEKVRLLERLNGQPIPQDAHAQIEILRQIYADSGQGMSNILDVKDISDRRGVFTAQRLSQAETLRLVGTDRPTPAQADNAIDNINMELARGECVCFPVYDAAANGPVGWYFVGNTVD